MSRNQASTRACFPNKSSTPTGGFDIFKMRTIMMVMDIYIVKSPFDDLVASQGVRLSIKYLTLFLSNFF